MTYLPPHDYENFGSAGNLGQNINDMVEFDNLGGYSTIAFRCTAPTGGEATFEATFDGTNWETITMRSIENDIFESKTNNNSDFIGSIAAVRKFRVRTSVGGSGAGTVMGRAQRGASILESIEFGYPPHRFGFYPIHKDASFSTAQTGISLWTPASGKKFVLTDLLLVASGTTDGTVTIFDETDATGGRVFKAALDVSNNYNAFVIHAFSTPYVSNLADNILKLTTSADIDVDIMLHGYEI